MTFIIDVNSHVPAFTSTAPEPLVQVLAKLVLPSVLAVKSSLNSVKSPIIVDGIIVLATLWLTWLPWSLIDTRIVPVPAFPLLPGFPALKGFQHEKMKIEQRRTISKGKRLRFLLILRIWFFNLCSLSIALSLWPYFKICNTAI